MNLPSPGAKFRAVGTDDQGMRVAELPSLLSEHPKLLYAIPSFQNPTGTSLRDFMKGKDLSRVSEEIVEAYDTPGTPDGVKVYRPEVVGAR